MSDTPPASTPEPAPADWALGRRRRRRESGRRTNRVNLRLSDTELAELNAAAARTGETAAGYAARHALAAARGRADTDAPPGVDVEEVREIAYGLMQSRTHLGRIGSLLNQAVTVLHSTGAPPAYLADAVQRCAAAITRVDDATQAVIRVLSPRRVPRQRRADHRGGDAER
ncbi:hypothetical protein [Micromonospora tarensis]|uniref:Ribbon-helix-helix protein, copG family n=1 Tax=Micromonospora tarensis TaxID=2806100 RepID=A0ABS1YQY0_9ACTN|nr:hypothetical protein [Micromonospora tarensis]MBM0279831.1 hypothetical protein [Micromonospora tarensis]